MENSKLNCLWLLLRVVLAPIIFTYYMDPIRSKLSRFDWNNKFFYHILSLRNFFVFIASLYLAYFSCWEWYLSHVCLLYILYWPKTGKLSRLDLKKIILSYFIIVKLFCFYTKFVTSIFWLLQMVFITHLIYTLNGPKTAKLSRLEFKKKGVIIIYHCKTFLFIHQFSNWRILEVSISAHAHFFKVFCAIFFFFFVASNLINTQLFIFTPISYLLWFGRLNGYRWTDRWAERRTDRWTNIVDHWGFVDPKNVTSRKSHQSYNYMFKLDTESVAWIWFFERRPLAVCVFFRCTLCLISASMQRKLGASVT